jgi:hypothetical protein
LAVKEEALEEVLVEALAEEVLDSSVEEWWLDAMPN